MAIHRLCHPQGLSLAVSTWGATWLQCELPWGATARRAVILPRTEAGDAGARDAFLGSTVGRYANRIAQATIEHGGHAWALATAPGQRHQLHGGPGGFHSREWDVLEAAPQSLRLGLVSEDGDQGFPGQLQVRLHLRLRGPLSLEMAAEAQVSAPCPVAITQHAYFNLDGHLADARGQSLQLQARQWLPVDDDLIPLGALADVHGTGFDFRSPKPIARDWARDEVQRAGAGFDHAFLLDEACRDLSVPAARLTSADGRLAMALETTMPALQLYAGQMLRGAAAPTGEPIARCAGIALEPQFLPDSPHHPEWPQPSCWLLPGQTYRHVIRWNFEVA